MCALYYLFKKMIMQLIKDSKIKWNKKRPKKNSNWLQSRRNGQIGQIFLMFLGACMFVESAMKNLRIPLDDL